MKEVKEEVLPIEFWDALIVASEEAVECDDGDWMYDERGGERFGTGEAEGDDGDWHSDLLIVARRRRKGSAGGSSRSSFLPFGTAAAQQYFQGKKRNERKRQYVPICV
ncbi:unnamed protein product [Linum trigynum]|uniref:Uncharacterized protein n=1 Tax=Linum trigynum TaxID=586398 RepID=A0AAV2GWQ3_9ROSI